MPFVDTIRAFPSLEAAILWFAAFEVASVVLTRIPRLGGKGLFATGALSGLGMHGLGFIAYRLMQG